MSDLNAIFRNGKIVAAPMPYIGNLQLDVSANRLAIAKMQADASLFSWEDDYSDDTGIDDGEGRSSGYIYDETDDYVSNTGVGASQDYSTSSNVTNSDVIILLVPAGEVGGDGGTCRFTCKSAATWNLDSMYVSEVAASGNAWDAAADITQVTFSSSPGFTGAANTDYVSDVIEYDWDDTQDHLIAFYGPSLGRPGVGPAVSGGVVWRKSTTSGDDAAEQVRESGYTTESHTWCGITKLEIFSTPQNMTLYSNIWEAPSAPDNIAIFGTYEQPDEDVTLGTNLVIEVSRGSTESYVTVGDFVLEENGTNCRFIGYADLSGEASGTDLRVRFTTPGGSPAAVKITGWKGSFD